MALPRDSTHRVAGAARTSAAGTVVAALLFPGELIDRVPTDPWDRPVTALVSPAGWLELTWTGRGNA